MSSTLQILLISPFLDVGLWTDLRLPNLALYILEGLTPPEHKVRIVEGDPRAIDLDQECDLVGISCMTPNAPSAYGLADEFRKRGRTVVMGGIHPTVLPDEALQHADCVVVGEAEGVWETLLQDFQHGRLQQRYHDPAPDLTRYVPKAFSRMPKGMYGVVPIMTSRGCPYECEFCSVSDIYGRKIRHIPIENVVRDIRESGARTVGFLDDNIVGDSIYAKQLFAAIKPLGIHWAGQASVSLLVRDDALLRLAAESGCVHLLMGLESVSEVQVRAVRKMYNEIEQLEAALEKIRKQGILVHASMVFGFDTDTLGSFDDTVRYLVKNRLGSANFNILTPHPGTKVRERLKREGRLLNSDWQNYDHQNVVFKPMNMTPFELQSGNSAAWRKFYSPASVLKRLPANMAQPGMYLATNYGLMRGFASRKRESHLLRTGSVGVEGGSGHFPIARVSGACSSSLPPGLDAVGSASGMPEQKTTEEVV